MPFKRPTDSLAEKSVGLGFERQVRRAVGFGHAFGDGRPVHGGLGDAFGRHVGPAEMEADDEEDGGSCGLLPSGRTRKFSGDDNGTGIEAITVRTTDELPRPAAVEKLQIIDVALSQLQGCQLNTGRVR